MEFTEIIEVEWNDFSVHTPTAAPILAVVLDDFDAGVEAAAKEADLATHKYTLKEKL